MHRSTLIPGLLIVTFSIGALPLWSQTTAIQKASFEVASVRPAAPQLSPNGFGGPTDIQALPGGRLTVTNLSLSDLIRCAYGITGEFDFRFEYAADETKPGDFPTLTTAIQESLGLRLVSTKGPVTVLVVDSVQKPSEN